MKCAWVQERLLLYLSGELGGWQEARVLRHLDGCDRCTAHAASIAATQQQAQAALRVEAEAPETLDARVMEAVRRLPAPRRSVLAALPWAAARVGWAAVLASGLLGGGFAFGRWSAPFPAVATAAPDFRAFGAAHRRVALAGSRPEVTASDPEELGRALAPLVRFPVTPVDLRPEETRLVGGSRQVVQGAPVACLHYEWRGQRVSLFQVAARPPPGQAASAPETYVAERGGGLSYVAWNSGGVRCVLVSHAMPMHQLFHLACRACERQGRRRAGEASQDS